MFVPILEDISECDDILWRVILSSKRALVLNGVINIRTIIFFAIISFHWVLLVKLRREGSAYIAFILFAYKRVLIVSSAA